jgi:hypothetical protein
MLVATEAAGRRAIDLGEGAGEAFLALEAAVEGQLREIGPGPFVQAVGGVRQAQSADMAHGTGPEPCGELAAEVKGRDAGRFGDVSQTQRSQEFLSNMEAAALERVVDRGFGCRLHRSIVDDRGWPVLTRIAPVAWQPVTAYRPSTISAAFSAIMMVGALVLPETRRGITEASTTLRPSTPQTRNFASTTAMGP